LAEQRFEIWAYVVCKSPMCKSRIFLGKLGDAQPFRRPVGVLSPDAHCTDFEERCPECGLRYTYTKRDVLVSDALNISEIPAVLPSSAFRYAVTPETNNRG
jgi:hypothetical protein